MILHKGVGAAFMISPDLSPTGGLPAYPDAWHGWKTFDTDSTNRLHVQCHFLVIHGFFFTPILWASRAPRSYHSTRHVGDLRSQSLSVSASLGSPHSFCISPHGRH